MDPLHGASLRPRVPQLSNNSRVLDLVHRYETGFDRQFSRALSLILKRRDSQWSETETPDALPPSAGALLTWAPDSPRDAPPLAAPNFPNESTSVQPSGSLKFTGASLNAKSRATVPKPRATTSRKSRSRFNPAIRPRLH